MCLLSTPDTINTDVVFGSAEQKCPFVSKFDHCGKCHNHYKPRCFQEQINEQMPLVLNQLQRITGAAFATSTIIVCIVLFLQFIGIVYSTDSDQSGCKKR